ncbi:expressed unknown protein [Seminavis robusta]|uniref:Uncharacterized protein n=1 Tax=Seminavis robusta TaxID=568900 RepID=A0A9N8DLL0_9STRA|nr:expressed unknown protein [Seminavis robusta]|eukprot:Sro146_g067610.1 n/a (257) ;mRNA; f:68380-69434
MNTDNSDDDFELMKIVERRIAEAVEEQSNSQVIRGHDQLVGNRQHPREHLTALGLHNNNNAKSSGSHENDGFDLMEIVAQRAADAREAIDSAQAQEPGCPKSHHQALRPVRSLMGVMELQEQNDNIPSSSVAMTFLSRMPNLTEMFLQPGAYPVNGIDACLEEEDESSGSNNEDDNWEEEDIQAVAYPIDHQGLEELLPSGVPFIPRDRAAWKRKLMCYVSLQMIIGMLIVVTFLVVFVVGRLLGESSRLVRLGCT